MIGSRLGELGVKRLDDIRIGRSGLGDLQGAETVLRGHKVHEVGVDGVGDVDEELIRSAAIDGGKRSMWVIRYRSIQRQCRLMSAMRPTATVRAMSPN
jgi:hypothetical protein